MRDIKVQNTSSRKSDWRYSSCEVDKTNLWVNLVQLFPHRLARTVDTFFIKILRDGSSHLIFVQVFSQVYWFKYIFGPKIIDMIQTLVRVATMEHWSYFLGIKFRTLEYGWRVRTGNHSIRKSQSISCIPFHRKKIVFSLDYWQFRWCMIGYA